MMLPSIRVYCAPHGETFIFPSDGMAAVMHANAHGRAVKYTEADGLFIGHPEPQHTPTPPITKDDIMDMEDMPLDVWSAFAREYLRTAEPV